MTTRLAPTPSGFLHAGNAANFALNALLAGPEGRILLRIDDLDRARFREEYLADIFRVIDWLGINVTDGPTSPADFHANWSQVHRLPEYRAALEQLRTSPEVYACTCSRKSFGGERHQRVCLAGKLSLDAPGVAWRLRVPRLAQTVPNLGQPPHFLVDLHREMGDFVLRKKDGSPSYQLACVVDDVLFGVDCVGRGQDLLPSTAAQALLSDLLGYPPLYERISFLHHSLIIGADGEKLSKSAGGDKKPMVGFTGQQDDFFKIATGWLSGQKL